MDPSFDFVDDSVLPKSVAYYALRQKPENYRINDDGELIDGDGSMKI